jgi:two-component system chemotaxis sensor kinase CheA
MADDLLNEFIHESREHLATIEADLLTIEEAGDNVDEDLVNKVFRAAHSIKGGSSFFGLAKVKELSHKAETVLDMLRSRKMIANAEVTNVLLAAFDKLREMINSPGESDRADVSDLVVSLTGLASSYMAPDEKASLTQSATLHAKGVAPVVVSQVDLDRARRSGQCVYCVDYDLIHDIEKKGLNILKVFRELGESGEIFECFMDFEAAGTLDDAIGNQLPLRLVFATTLAPHIMPELLSIPEEKIKILFDPVAQSTTPPAAAAAPAPAPVEHTPAARVTTAAPVPAPVAEPEVQAQATPEPKERPQPSAGRGGTAESAAGGSHAPADETLRVNVGLLESLMNLAGELVLSRNQLRSAIAQNDVQALPVAEQRLNQVTSDLQDAIMRTRLQPIGNVFGKFPRVVRDMANTLQKEITLDIRGKDVALDRSLIEGLSDPLTHMVRNAVDHGVETPQERTKSGKRSTGTIRIEARHEAGQVVVEIADDGKGIDPTRVADAALRKGLITPEKVRAMSEKDKTALIFLPGLSTAKQVTDISGRGVGMDVVKSNIDRLGGTVEIKSEIGKGSVFRIKMPLTLAIIPSLIVAVGEDRFAIPQVNVEELLCLRANDVDKRIEVVGEAKVLVLRDRIIPLVRFRELLRLTSDDTVGCTSTRAGATFDEALRIVVVTTGSMQYGLAVDSFHDTEEIVVKPLGRHIKGLREYAGGTILGDGRVALILDVAGLATKAELGAAVEAARTAEEEKAAERERLEDMQSFLLFHNAPDEVCATPLETVLRIQRVTPEQVETKANRRTIQYRGTSLPLVTLSDSASVQSIGDSRELAVIVSSVRGREVGLLGCMPVDVVETRTAIDTTTHRQKGISGSVILNDRTMLIADIVELVETAYPDWGAPPAERDVRSVAGSVTSKTVLLAEDSDFFRAQVKKYLEQDGYRVLEAPDGEEAWERLEDNAGTVDAVVTDVEMPRLTGLGLAQRIRGDDRFARIPIIALSSLAGEDDIARGRAAGVDDYQVKLDRDRLIAGLQALLPTA